MISQDKTELFVELVTRYQQRVYLFILSLLPNPAEAEEVLQETNLVLWRKFEEFEPGTNFKAWAFQTAYYKVQSFLSRQGRERARFGDAFLEKVAAMASELPDEHDVRREALSRCLEKLSQSDREVIRRRYRMDGTTKSVAEELGRSVDAIYKAVLRIRRKLHQCIRLALAAEERK